MTSPDQISLFLFLVFRHAPEFTLFPYTTLFRSLPGSMIVRSKRSNDGSAQSWMPELLSIASGGRRSRWKDRKSTRLNSSHGYISYAVFCLKKKKPPTSSSDGRRYTLSTARLRHQ